ncbi:MAG: glycerol-3-phosphate 1-O-acyltransferase PlsY [Thermoanaerobaculia bacterium]
MTGQTIQQVAVLVAAYLFGSLSFATILVRLFRGEDIRKSGSGNAGATNVLRTAGKGLGITTLVLDMLKGTLAVLAMRLVTHDLRWIAAAAVAGVLGHVFPVWFGFKGGKGVATAGGAFLVIAPYAVLAVIVFSLGVIALTRFVSLGSITGACLLPVAVRILNKGGDADVIAALAVAALLVITHRGNIRRLLNGTERRFGTQIPPAS